MITTSGVVVKKLGLNDVLYIYQEWDCMDEDIGGRRWWSRYIHKPYPISLHAPPLLPGLTQLTNQCMGVRPFPSLKSRTGRDY